LLTNDEVPMTVNRCRCRFPLRLPPAACRFPLPPAVNRPPSDADDEDLALLHRRSLARITRRRARLRRAAPRRASAHAER